MDKEEGNDTKKILKLESIVVHSLKQILGHLSVRYPPNKHSGFSFTYDEKSSFDMDELL